MKDPEKPPPEYTQPQTQSSGTVTLNTSYVISPRGILKIVEIFLLMIAFSCMANYCTGFCRGNFSFFLFPTIFPWILCIVIFVLYLFCLVEKIPQINWPVTVMINSIVWAVVILISSSLIADDIRKWEEVNRKYRAAGVSIHVDGRIYGGVVFGFLSIIAFVIDALYHFQLVRG